MRRLTKVLLAGLLVLALAACGDDSNSTDTSPEATSTTSASVTTSAESTATTGGGKCCVEIASEGLTLARNFANESRGVAGPPDEAAFREKARALRDEAEQLGCPIPAAVNQFLDG